MPLLICWKNFIVAGKLHVGVAQFLAALVYGILYQKVFAELDKRENSAKSSKSNPPADMTSPMVFYQNGLREEDSFKDEAEDNSGWTEVKSRSSKGEIIHLPSQFVKTMVSLVYYGITMSKISWWSMPQYAFRRNVLWTSYVYEEILTYLKTSLNPYKALWTMILRRIAKNNRFIEQNQSLHEWNSPCTFYSIPLALSSCHGIRKMTKFFSLTL